MLEPKYKTGQRVNLFVNYDIDDELVKVIVKDYLVINNQIFYYVQNDESMIFVSEKDLFADEELETPNLQTKKNKSLSNGYVVLVTGSFENIHEIYERTQHLFEAEFYCLSPDKKIIKFCNLENEMFSPTSFLSNNWSIIVKK